MQLKCVQQFSILHLLYCGLKDQPRFVTFVRYNILTKTHSKVINILPWGFIHISYREGVKFITDSDKKLELSSSTFLKFRYYKPIWPHHTSIYGKLIRGSEIFRYGSLIF